MTSDSSIDLKPILLMNPKERPGEALYKEDSTALMNYPRIKSEPEDFDTPSTIDSSEDSKPQVLELHCLPMVVPKQEGVPENFTCFVCNACFPSKSALDAHLLFHPQESPFSCDQCGEGFAKESELLMHRKNHDRYIQPVVYGFRTRTKVPLKVPSRNIRPCRRKYCNICTSTSVGSAEWRAHRKHH